MTGNAECLFNDDLWCGALTVNVAIISQTGLMICAHVVENSRKIEEVFSALQKGNRLPEWSEGERDRHAMFPQ